MYNLCIIFSFVFSSSTPRLFGGGGGAIEILNGEKDYFTKNVNAIIKCCVKNIMYSKTRLKQKARHE